MVNMDMFELPIHKLIFENITDIYLEQQPINLITVYKSIQQNKSLNKRDAAIELSNIHSMFTAQDKLELESAIIMLTAESIRHEHIDLGKKIVDISESETYDPKKALDLIQSHISDNKFKALLNKKEFTNKDLLDELDKRMAEASIHDGISGIQTGYYFIISNSNVGKGVTSLNSSGSVVGVGTSFIDGVYNVYSVSVAQTSVVGLGVTFVAKVTVRVSGYNGLNGIGYSGYYGNYSWGRIVLESRSKSNSYTSYSTNGYPGISTGTLITRTRPLKYANYTS
jgi:hypothetical protein